MTAAVAERAQTRARNPRWHHLSAEQHDRLTAIAVLLVANGCGVRWVEECCDVSSPTAQNLFGRARHFLTPEREPAEGRDG